MAELKTKKNKSSVMNFINSIDHEGKRNDAMEILEMMRKITGEQPKMWGSRLS